MHNKDDASTNSSAPRTGLSYKDAGVDIDAGNQLVQQIKPIAAKTHRPGVMAGLGGFGAMFELPLDRYRKPILVSGTDGVGTKLKLAIDLKSYDSIGIDLVAMCANDIIVLGAEPLFFLDYYATGKLDNDVAVEVIRGIGAGCELAGAALSGGETAEMPGMYAKDDFDLAGFCVGIVEKDNIIDGSKVKPGDQLIGLASSGPHSNGYSLIRKVIDVAGADLAQPFNESTLGASLLAPTRIYVKALLKLLEKTPVHAMAHITGGGLLENIPRVLPDSCAAIIRQASWEQPNVFTWLQEQGNISDEDMYLTFNCGVGMVICIAPENLQTALDSLAAAGENAWHLGEIINNDQDAAQVQFL